MANHPFYYSMVLDGHPVHPYQADTLAFTLQRFGDVPPDRIVAHCTNRVSERVREALADRGLEVVPVTPYLDGTYCNKITQLDRFLEVGGRAEGVFLFDLDVAILAPLDVPDRASVWGKIVDDTNPPLDLLERVFRTADVPLPNVLPCDWSPPRGDTLATNFNGGLLYIPLTHVKTLRHTWRQWAEYLFRHEELFEGPAERSHIDQMSFALAVASHRLPYGHLTANWNFPGHYTRWPRSFDPESPVHALHYHQCLDRFGLVAPVFSHDALDEAVAKLNDEIGQREPSLFFDLYKTHLAQQAVQDVPEATQAVFPAEFIARTGLRDHKRRLILHAGTPKTGTSSLQRHLDENRPALAERGVWYPPTTDPREPKHQDVVWALQAADPAGFVHAIVGALRDMPHDTHTIVLSTEGIFNHWWDYAPLARALLRDLARLFDFEMCICFRSPDSFAAALYAQYLRNPARNDAPRNVYGRDIDFAEAMCDEWFRQHLDYLGFCREAEALLGKGSVRPMFMSNDVVRTFLRCYDIDGPSGSPPRENESLSSAGVDLMRIANRLDLSVPEQQRVEGLVRDIDRVIRPRSTEFRLEENDARLVQRYAARGWRTLRSG